MAGPKQHMDDLNTAALKEGEAQLRGFLDKYGDNIDDVGAVVKEFRRLRDIHGVAGALSMLATKILNDDAKSALMKAFGGNLGGATGLLSALFADDTKSDD